MLCVECLVLDQSQDAAGSSNNNVRAVVLQNLLVLLNADATKEDRNFDVVKVLAESLVLFVDLKCQLSGMCEKHTQNRCQLKTKHECTV